MVFADAKRLELNDHRALARNIIIVFLTFLFTPMVLLPTILYFVLAAHLTLAAEVTLPLSGIICLVIYLLLLGYICHQTRMHRHGCDEPPTLNLVYLIDHLSKLGQGPEFCHCVPCTIEQCAADKSRTKYAWKLRRDVYSAVCPAFLAKRLDTTYYATLTYKVNTWCTDNVRPLPSQTVITVLVSECALIISRLMIRRNAVYNDRLADLNHSHATDMAAFSSK